MVRDSENSCMGSMCMSGAGTWLFLYSNLYDKVRNHIFKEIDRNHQCLPNNVRDLIYNCLKISVLDPVLYL